MNNNTGHEPILDLLDELELKQLPKPLARLIKSMDPVKNRLRWIMATMQTTNPQIDLILYTDNKDYALVFDNFHTEPTEYLEFARKMQHTRLYVQQASKAKVRSQKRLIDESRPYMIAYSNHPLRIDPVFPMLYATKEDVEEAYNEFFEKYAYIYLINQGHTDPTNKKKLGEVIHQAVYKKSNIQPKKLHIVNISSKQSAEPLAKNLSNFTPRHFTFDGIECVSIESVLQAFKFQDIEQQERCCQKEAFIAKSLGKKSDWQKDQMLYWQGLSYHRDSNEYQALLTRLYECVYDADESFQKDIALSKDYILIHTMGKELRKQTVLNEIEFIQNLMKLQGRKTKEQRLK